MPKGAQGRAGGGESSIFIEFLYRCPSIHLENIWRKWHLIEARGRSRFGRRHSARCRAPRNSSLLAMAVGVERIISCWISPWSPSHSSSSRSRSATPSPAIVS